MKNKFIALLMILATFVILPCMAEAAESGKCGDDLTWTLDDNGTLVISGTGEMWDFGYTDEEAPPWCDLDIAVKKIKINDGATSISESAFRYLLSASEVSLPNSLLHIGR